MSGTMRVNSVVVGCKGEVGMALMELLQKHHDVYGADLNYQEVFDECEYLNVCIPYSADFVVIVNGYVEAYKPRLTIIHSTVPVGTTKQIKGCVVHSPVRGKHPEMLAGLQRYDKYIGYNDEESYALAIKYFGNIFQTQMIENSNSTELMKLASLAKYLVYLAVADEIKDVCNKIGVPYAHIKNWDATQNEMIDWFYPNMRWPLIDPPKGKIGGHCVMPVSEMFLGECDKHGIDTKVVAEAFTKFQGNEDLALL
jgi:hypothetical protein